MFIFLRIVIAIIAGLLMAGTIITLTKSKEM